MVKWFCSSCAIVFLQSYFCASVDFIFLPQIDTDLFSQIDTDKLKDDSFVLQPGSAKIDQKADF